MNIQRILLVISVIWLVLGALIAGSIVTSSWPVAVFLMWGLSFFAGSFLA